MARIARAVAPGISHHITQRGNRRQEVFFKDEDYQAYIELMSEWCLKYHVAAWTYASCQIMYISFSYPIQKKVSTLRSIRPTAATHE